MKRNQLFSDLGKATLRGVKKCPKCHTLNGIRSTICKNEQCQSGLSTGVSRKRKFKCGLDCVKLVTHSSGSKIHSIRVRDRGPEYRGFVELPCIRGLDASSDPSLDTKFIEETTGRCFIESCRRESLPLQTTCTKTRNPADLAGSGEAETSITLTIISSCPHLKEAVKCEDEAVVLEINPEAIEGLLIEDDKRQNLKEYISDLSQLNYLCLQRVSTSSFVCRTERSSKDPCGFLHICFTNHDESQASKSFNCSCKQFKAEKPLRRCLHYYLCLMCFISHRSLSAEFKTYLQSDLVDQTQNLEKYHLSEDGGAYALNNGKKHLGKRSTTVNEAKYTFMDWLGTVTELINETMHYQFSGRPEPLSFHVPHQYFNCLLQRIATILKKKAVPSVTTVFKRKDTVPIGTFTKFTYILHSLSEVKQIFDTPQVELLLTQKFTRNRDGDYERFETLRKNQPQYVLSSDSSPIKEPHLLPLELRTFLKVGSCTFEGREPVPFTIEWVPDVLPKSKVGELRIHFQFGHLSNGSVERKEV